MKKVMQRLYEGLKGTRTVNGELTVDGFESDDYEELYYTLIENLRPYFSEDYYTWYQKVCTQYVRYRKSTNRRYDFYCRQAQLGEHTMREELAVLKFFIYRRATSKYSANVERTYKRGE